MGKYKLPKGPPISKSAPVSVPSSQASSREPSPFPESKGHVKKMGMPNGAKIGLGVMGALGMLGAGYGIGYYNRGGLGNNMVNKVPLPTPTPRPIQTPRPRATPNPGPTPHPFSTPEPGGQFGFRDMNGYTNPVAA